MSSECFVLIAYMTTSQICQKKMAGIIALSYNVNVLFIHISDVNYI